MSSTEDPLEAVRKLFPQLSDQELESVQEMLDGYASVVWQISERLERENPEMFDALMRKKEEREKQQNQGI